MSLQSGHQELRVYESHSSIRHPFLILWAVMRDLFAFRQLATTLAIRDLRAQYRQSALGFLWAVLPPLFFSVGLTVLRENSIVTLQGPAKIPYSAYVLISTTLWQMFMNAVTAPLNALSASKGILTRVNFPRETVVCAEMLKQGFDVLIRLLIIALTMLWFQIPISTSIALFPFALIQFMIMGMTIGLFLAPIALLYRDIMNALPMIGYLWMALTPVLMTIEDLSPGGVYAWIVKLNPATPLLMVTRELLLGMPVTDLMAYGGWSIVMWIGLALSLIYFRVAMPVVIERWSA